MAQYLQGQLSGLSIEQKEDLPKSVSCTQDCLQYLEMPDMQVQTGTVCRISYLQLQH